MRLFRKLAPRAARGFSLLEMMVVIVIVSIVIAAVLTQVDQTQQRASADEGKLDQFQAARTFVDQISSDARQMGYPNSHNFDVTATISPAWQSPLMNDSRVAIGLVKITSNSLQFEGDVDGSGTVSEVFYTVNGDGNCATCLERSQLAKINGNPLTGQTAPVYSAEIQNVQNATSATRPIFKAYNSAGAGITLPIDISTNPTNIANVRSIQITLDVADPLKTDPKTKQPLEANISSRVQVVNCSMAATGLATAGGIQLTCQ